MEMIIGSRGFFGERGSKLIGFGGGLLMGRLISVFKGVDVTPLEPCLEMSPEVLR